jgi:hypothetical protein
LAHGPEREDDHGQTHSSGGGNLGRGDRGDLGSGDREQPGRWGQRQATAADQQLREGQAEAGQRDPQPNCAQGKTKPAPIQLRLSKPVKCSNGKLVFAKVRFTWTQGAPSKFPDTGSVPLGCKLF